MFPTKTVSQNGLTSCAVDYLILGIAYMLIAVLIGILEVIPYAKEKPLHGTKSIHPERRGRFNSL